MACFTSEALYTEVPLPGEISDASDQAKTAADSSGYSVMSRVFKNGLELQSSGWSYWKTLDDALLTWEINLIIPIEVLPTDTFSIWRAFGGTTSTTGTSLVTSPTTGAYTPVGSRMAGGFVVEDAPADGLDLFLDSDLLASKVRGKSSASGGLTNKALEKDIYFINSDWLNQSAPWGWKIVDGVIYYRMSQSSPTYVKMVVDGLPSKDIPDGTYELVVGTSLHSEIGRRLADRLGYDFYSNCPGITVKKVFQAKTSESLTTILWNLSKLWNPTISVEGSTTGRPKICVMDHLKAGQTPASLKSITLSSKSTSFLSREDPVSDKAGIVDHVTIKGMTGQLVNSQVLSLQQSQSTQEIPEVSYSEDACLKSTTDNTPLFRKKTMGDHKAQFGKPSEKTPRKPRRELTRTEYSEYYHIDAVDSSKYIIIRSTQDQFALDSVSNSEVLVHRVQVRHKYGAGYQPIGSEETEWMSCRVPGMKSYQWIRAKSKIVDQSKIYTEIKKAESTELIEEKIVATKVVPAPPDKPYYTAPIRLSVAHENDYISTSPKTRQVLLEMTSKVKNTKINRANKDMLIQFISEFDFIGGLTKYNSQIIQNPSKPKAGATTEATQFVRDYTSGAGPYHPALVFEHPDIDSEDVAFQVAQRLFSRSASKKKIITVKVLAPLALKTLPVKVTTPSFAITALLQTRPTGGPSAYTEEEAMEADPPFTVISGGGIVGESYFAVGFGETVSTKPMTHEIKMQLRSVL